ncbi:MAG: lactate utilization protein [Patescibacteria group bacterium]|nr:lactate utilization protein [Patescibacteria group bacterium]
MTYDQLASPEAVQETINALKGRNIEALLVNTKEEALEKIKEMIPAGASVMTGGSTTLNEIGFSDLLVSKNHPWKNLKDEIVAETDPDKQNELRKRSVLADYFLGSVHAVAKDGEVLVASASGSQIPSYAFTSPNVIWVVGTQKIVGDLSEAFDRVKTYVFPLEDQRMKSAGAQGSVIARWLVFEREIMPSRKVTLIFVNEKLGF